MACPIDLWRRQGCDGVGILAFSDLLLPVLEQREISLNQGKRSVAEERDGGVGAGVAFDGVEERAVGHEVEGQMACEALAASGGEVLREAQHFLREW